MNYHKASKFLAEMCKLPACVTEMRGFHALIDIVILCILIILFTLPSWFPFSD